MNIESSFVTGFWKTNQLVPLSLFYFILLAQLMPTFVHYTSTVLLPGLVNWSALLERILILYGGKLWQGESLVNWLVSSIWWKKVWWIDRSVNRLLIISTNLDGFSLANHGRFAKFAKVSLRTVYQPCFCLGSTVSKNNHYTLYVGHPVINMVLWFVKFLLLYQIDKLNLLSSLVSEWHTHS